MLPCLCHGEELVGELGGRKRRRGWRGGEARPERVKDRGTEGGGDKGAERVGGGRGKIWETRPERRQTCQASWR